MTIYAHIWNANVTLQWTYTVYTISATWLPVNWHSINGHPETTLLRILHRNTFCTSSTYKLHSSTVNLSPVPDSAVLKAVKSGGGRDSPSLGTITKSMTLPPVSHHRISDLEQTKQMPVLQTKSQKL